MAGPSIVVRVLGDVKQFAGSMRSAGDTAESTGSRIHSAFSGVLSTLNQSGVLGPFGQALDGIDESFSRLEDHGHRLGQSMMVLGGTFAGIGLGLTALGSKDQAARQQLQASVEAVGGSWDDYSARVEAAIHHEERYAHNAAETQNALQVLVQATGSADKALGLLNVTTDLAAAKHESLVDAATQIAKTYNGSTKLLKQFGINVASSATATKAAATATKQAQTADDKLAAAKQRLADLEAIDASRKKLTVTQAVRLHDAQVKVTDATKTATAAHQQATAAQQAATEATKNQASGIDQLSGRLDGQAKAASHTFLGELKAIGVEFEDQAAMIGAKYGPQIDFVSNAFSVLGGIVSASRAILDKFKKTTEETTKATEAQAAASKETTLALRVQAAAEVLAETLGLPLWATVGLIIAAVVALGVAAYEVYTHWSAIWAGMKAAAVAVWNWIKQNWPYLVGILAGPFGLAAAWIYKHWDAVLDFLKRLPGRIASAVVGLWDSVWHEFLKVMHQIEDYHVKLPGPLGGAHFNLGSVFFGLASGKIPGTDIGIPGFQHGGIMPYTGLAYLHAGETVTPAGRTGPAVEITGPLHFSSEVDVELFARKLAWTVQTQRI